MLAITGACWVWATVSFVLAARQVTPEWVQTRSLSMFYIVLQGPFVIGGIGFGVIDSFLPLRQTLLVAALAFVPGLLAIPRFRLPKVDRSSLQLVASPSLTIGEHIRPDDGPVLILIEYDIDAEDVDDFLLAMADLRIVRRRLGGTRWGVYQDVTAYGKFFETFLVPSWQGYLLQRAHYTKADKQVEDRAFAFHRSARRTYNHPPRSPRGRRGRSGPVRLAGRDAPPAPTSVGEPRITCRRLDRASGGSGRIASFSPTASKTLGAPATAAARVQERGLVVRPAGTR